ncbi:FAD-dependent oxidoreductase [Salipiger sp. P9]|uniref:oxidoreductase n=1 Tax=Salipiger pentaromativorans TaxID=2943193 RepID=UPI002157376A|nr:FAD-dependent oxidoreductase [Salipiger pentaromativorans]
MQPHLSPLFQPLAVGPVVLPNRIMLPAMTTRLAGATGEVSPGLLAYYEARARGGAGLVMVEMAEPMETAGARSHGLALWSDAHVAGLSRLAARLRAAGACAGLQIGIAPLRGADGGRQALADLTQGDLERVAAACAGAMRRAGAAGFDVVEIQASYGKLLHQFLSPLTNRRRDAYGGPLPNRLRLVLEVVRACRAAAAPGMALGIRISGDDLVPGGVTGDEAVELAGLAVAAGVDLVNVGMGSRQNQAMMAPTMEHAAGLFLPQIARIRAAVPVPVAGAGRIHRLDLAEAALAAGQLDIVAVGRQLIADPDWPNKLRAGRAETARPCISCNTCIETVRAGGRLSCLVNGFAGRETELNERSAAAPRKLLVIGAGPAGLEAARLAARRGHRVTLWERRRAAGGALRLAALAPRFQWARPRAEVLERFVRYLETAARAEGVAITYGQRATAARIAAFGADVTILATGARYRFGLGLVVPLLLRAGLLRRWPLRGLARSERLHDLFLYRLRRRDDRLARRLVALGCEIETLGDGAAPGKTQQAIAAATECATRL